MAMEVNKDESERCIEIAIAAASFGQMDKAEKFLRKADKLFPSQRAKDLLARLASSAAGGGRSSSSSTDAKSAPKKAPTEPEPPQYTSAQLEMVRRIKRCKDYYEVLNVTHDSTDGDIKKAYKRLALQLHPDKNQAPGAVEAFKAVGNAVAVLTDDQKRKAYDLYGDDSQKMFSRRSNQQSSSQHHHHHHHHNGNGSDNHEYEHAYARGGGFDSDFTAEELFNMFFGNGFPQQRVNQRHQRYQNPRNESAQPSWAFCLILVLIVISMLSSFFTSDPVYSLSSSSRYPVRRNTGHLNIPYYVKDNFDREYVGSLSRLESSVEEEYISVMKNICFRERSYREMMISRARSTGDRNILQQAYALKVPSCENLAKIGLSVNY